MYLAIVGLPWISYIVGAVLGRRCGRKGVSYISSICIVVSAILAIVGEMEVVLRESPVSVRIMKWMGLERMDVEWGLMFDATSMTMTVVVLTISGLVHVYSNWYLGGDAHIIRYLSYLSLFTAMMVLMVTADNYILMFVGWEGKILCLKWSRRYTTDKGKREGDEEIDEEIREMIIGSLLGDSHLERRKEGRGTRLKLEQCGRNVEYIMWFHKKLAEKGYCREERPELKKRIREGGKIYYHYSKNSYTFVKLNKLHDMFYEEREGRYEKKVGRELERELTPRVLAIWFMDDGSLRKEKVRIATNNLKKEEVKELSEMLMRVFGIEASAVSGGKGKGWVLNVYKGSKKRFEELVRPVRPYMLV